MGHCYWKVMVNWGHLGRGHWGFTPGEKCGTPGHPFSLLWLKTKSLALSLYTLTTPSAHQAMEPRASSCQPAYAV
jgi:hypothetical protein